LHVYVGWRLWSLPVLEGARGHRILVMGLAAAYVAYPVGRNLFNNGWTVSGRIIEYGGAVWIGVLVLLVSALGLVDLITLFGLFLKPWAATLRTGAVVVVLLLSVVAWIGGFVQPRVIEIEVELPNLKPESDGLVVAHVSDVHLGALIGERRLLSLIDQINSMHPDVVAITGDLVDGHAGTVQSMIPVMRTLKAPLGVYAVLGNHEFYAGPQSCRELIRASGFNVLEFDGVEVEPDLWIAGVPDSGRDRTKNPIDRRLGAALRKVPKDAALIFLQHAPVHEQIIADAGVGLMLNGHTHGAQIWPAHYLVRREYPHLAGVYRVGAMTQVVSRGAGTWGPPMRLFAPSDIYRITLRSPAETLNRTDLARRGETKR
jgi:predicted MPP superfamily phosphohydrolase